MNAFYRLKSLSYASSISKSVSLSRIMRILKYQSFSSINVHPTKKEPNFSITIEIHLILHISMMKQSVIVKAIANNNLALAQQKSTTSFMTSETLFFPSECVQFKYFLWKLNSSIAVSFFHFNLKSLYLSHWNWCEYIWFRFEMRHDLITINHESLVSDTWL